MTDLPEILIAVGVVTMIIGLIAMYLESRMSGEHEY